ncbi:hypothetical protein [Mesorhizobium sp. M0118]|uniref:hypothetical protein n=1 Tax=Mesorhizobium sp. M0118 TaxID=2956884 RepID=UPI0033377A0D
MQFTLQIEINNSNLPPPAKNVVPVRLRGSQWLEFVEIPPVVQDRPGIRHSRRYPAKPAGANHPGGALDVIPAGVKVYVAIPSILI